MKKTIVLTVSGICNLSCSYCNLQYGGRYIPLRVIKEYLDYRDPFNDSYIILSGGEPTIHPEIREIIRHIEERGNPSQIITNGTKILEYIDDIKTMKINLSLSVLDPELMDKKDVITYKILPKLVRSHPMGKRGIVLSPVFKGKFDKFRELLEFSRVNGFGLTLNILSQLPKENGIAYYHNSSRLDIEELDKLRAYYREIYTEVEDWWITPEAIDEFYRRYKIILERDKVRDEGSVLEREEVGYWKCQPCVNFERDFHISPSDNNGGILESHCTFYNKNSIEDLDNCFGCLDLCYIQNSLDNEEC